MHEEQVGFYLQMQLSSSCWLLFKMTLMKTLRGSGRGGCSLLGFGARWNQELSGLLSQRRGKLKGLAKRDWAHIHTQIFNLGIKAGKPWEHCHAWQLGKKTMLVLVLEGTKGLQFPWYGCQHCELCASLVLLCCVWEGKQNPRAQAYASLH